MTTIENGFRIQNGILLKYLGSAEEVTLPKDVIRIAPYAFADCKQLKKVVTPYKLGSIGKGAFYGCDNLLEVTIPGKLFRRVKGGKVFPPDNNIYFRFYASSGDQSEDEDYSDSFGSEEEYVASGVDDSVMHAASEIVTIVEDLPDEDDEYSDEDLDPETLQEKMDAIIPPDPAAQELSAVRRHELVNLSDYLIEDDVVIKYIGTSRITIVPDFISRIGENAFSNSDVESVTLPAGLQAIGKNAFSWCRNLQQITVPDSVQMIDDGAFSNCDAMVKVTLSRGLKFIGANAFRACSALKELNLPDSLTNIGRRAFDFCVEIEKVTVPLGITTLAEGVFSHCEALRIVRLPADLTEIGPWAFADCYELREINFPPALLRVGEVAFINCRSLIAFDMPNSVKSLGRQAFVGCTGLRLVNLPAHLEKSLKPNKVFHRLDNVSITFVEDDAPPTI